MKKEMSRPFTVNAHACMQRQLTRLNVRISLVPNLKKQSTKYFKYSCGQV